MKETQDGDRYLVISETRFSGNELLKSRIMIFEDRFTDFRKGLDTIFDFLCDKKKSNWMEERKDIFPNAYQKWTPDEEELLREKYLGGVSINQISEDLQRQPGAIHSRLDKLGLKKS